MRSKDDSFSLDKDTSVEMNDQAQRNDHVRSNLLFEYVKPFRRSGPIGLNIDINFVTSIASDETCHSLRRQLGLTEEELNVLIESQSTIVDWLGSDKERWALFLSNPLLVFEKIVHPPLSLIKKLRQAYRQHAKQQGDSDTTYINRLSAEGIQ